MRDRFVSQQVRILLERMDMQPDEFVRPRHLGIGGLAGKWEYVLHSGEFNSLEKFLIRRKMKRLRRKATQEQILSTILNEQNSEENTGFSFDTVSRAAREALINNPYLRPTNKKEKGIK